MATESQALKPTNAFSGSWVDRVPLSVQPYLRLARMDGPIGTWLLYWPCVFGLALGAMVAGRPFSDLRDWWYVVLFGIGALVMRGAGCTYNDIIDRDIDAQVARTRGRPIPSGAVTAKQAAVFLGLQLIVGFLILISLNWFAVALGASSLVLIAIYPFMKRITWWPQAWLGLTFNWGALLGFAAVTGSVDLADLCLYAGCFFWTLGYDTIYAHQDREDDALIGVKSTARLLGARSRAWIRGFYAAAFCLILTAALAQGASLILIPLLCLAGAHMLWQVRKLDVDSPDACLKLFRANRDTGALIAAAFVISTFFTWGV
jgi:4-hydroxybenzoate polyprenyltransferase